MAAQTGDTVAVHYTGRLETGDVFDSSEGRDPLTFEVGAGQVIAGFDAAVSGKAVGDKTTVSIPPEEGYGPHRPELVQEIPRERMSEDVAPGQVVGLETEDGRQFQATVLEAGDESVRLDFNHFLAGKTLVFDIELVSVA